MKICSKRICFLLVVLLYPLVMHAQISVTANTNSVGTYNIYELTIQHPQSYKNNWEDVTVSTTFSGPQTIIIQGFFYNANTWKVRFAPPLAGSWSYDISFVTPANTFTFKGSFNCTQSTTKGFLRQHPHNAFRLIYPDGTLFNGIGLGDCILDNNNNGTPLDDFGFDGDFKPLGEARPYPLYYGSATSIDTYMKAYGSKGAGFNLFRWSTDNCSFRLYNNISPTGNTYFLNDGIYGDSLVQTLHKNDIRIWMTLFGYPLFKDINGSTPLEEAALKRYINYIVARYGAYIDIWELFNEAFASDYYITTVTGYLRSIDPYHRLISISDAQPRNAAIDINSPHWYEKESEDESDLRAWDMINEQKKFNKPIIYGEQGNSVQNWDPLSAIRMRVRSWTAFFAEGMFIFWNASWTKEYFHRSANIYLGPVERGYISAMQNFTQYADSAIRPFNISTDDFLKVRGYGLRSPKQILAYFHHYSSHSASTTTSFNYRLRQPGTIYWINPADNKILNSSYLSRGVQSLTSPSFTTDIAMRFVFDTSNVPLDTKSPLDIFVYPNPATNEFYLEGNFVGSVVIDLFDATGKRLYSFKNIRNNQKISIDGLRKGIYFYKVMTPDGRNAQGKMVVV